MTKKNIRTAIEYAANLRELMDTLNEYDENENEGFKLGDVADLSALPTYGGSEPDDTHGIWSWDENNIMIDGDGGDAFRIVPRNYFD